MDAISPAAPARPARPTWLRFLFGLAASLFLAAACGLNLRDTLPVLQTDFAIGDKAEPAPNARVVSGRCSTRLVLSRCEVVLEASPKPGFVWHREIVYDFFSLGGDRQVQVMRDPAQPELLTTDLGLDRLWNRSVMVAFTVIFAIGCLVNAVRLVIRRFA